MTRTPITAELATRGLLPWALLLGLSFFFGLAFEEFQANAGQKWPGGIRSFPLLAVIGALLYELEPERPTLLGIGLLSLTIWLGLYYWRAMEDAAPDGLPNVGLMVPICGVIAYLIGPISLAAPPWMATGLTVVSVLLLTARATLHAMARRIELAEIVNAGRFLLLTGLVLPLLPDHPVTNLTAITPYEAWLATVAVCAVSYASYLLRRYAFPHGSGLVIAALGGVYSATVTTIVLARRARNDAEMAQEARTGIIVANAVMYFRLLAIIAVFDGPLALMLTPAMVVLSALGSLLAGMSYWSTRRRVSQTMSPTTIVPNPLGFGTAASFGILFIVVSLLAAFMMRRFGSEGRYALAGVVGITDINPFVLSLAQHGVAPLQDAARAGAILIAVASNNVFQAIYAGLYSGGRTGPAVVMGLLLLAAAGLSAAFITTHILVEPNPHGAIVFYPR